MTNAMILAAGRGERMRPLTDHCPKPLLEVRGKPLIVHHIQALVAAGIESIVINTSWLAEQFPQKLGDGSRYGAHIKFVFEPEALETAGGIINALDYLEDDFIVVNGDVFCDADFEALKNLNLKPTLKAHLLLVQNPAHNSEGDFALQHGMISNQALNRKTFSGIARYRKSMFKGLQPGKVALAPLLRKYADLQQISGEIHQGVWSDVGTPERLGALR